MRAAIIDVDGLVETVVIVEAVDSYDPGPGLIAVDATGVTAYAGCTWTEEGGFVEPSKPLPTKDELIAYAADKRWQIETGGISVSGAEIRTDEKSQNRVSGAALLALSDPELGTIDWEAMPGEWVTVDKADMIAIGIAVGRHVQACFTALKAVQAEIDAGTITTTAEIDQAGWPGSS